MRENYKMFNEAQKTNLKKLRCMYVHLINYNINYKQCYFTFSGVTPYA